MLRAAVYRRISASRNESTSLEGQADSGEAYIRARGWTLVDTFTDDGISGGKDHTERPGLARLLGEARRGQFDVVVIAKLDRLARSLTVWNDTRSDLEAQGVAVASVAEGLDLTTPAGRMVANVLASFAEFERERIGERIREAGDRMAAQGRYFARPVPFGWQAVPFEGAQGLRLALHPEHAPYLLRVAEGIIDGTLSTGRAVAEAEAEGLTAFPAETGIRRLLRNPILLGQQVHQGEVVTGDDGLPITPHDPLVTPAQFRALDTAIRENQHGRPAPTGAAPRLLNALQILRCAECDRPLQLQRRRNPTRPRDRDVYACRRGHVSADARLMDDAVEALFLEALGRFDVTTVETTGDPEAAETLRGAVERRTALAGLVADGLMPQGEARGHLERLGATIARLETEVATGVGTEHVSTGHTFEETWQRSDTEGRRSLLAATPLTVMVERAGRGRRLPMRERLSWSMGDT